ncbi:uncharacterized protein LOC111044775 isoform X2 [Nilaparvata lugens]|uniref:uncharacterized protein LOC111044775 isoform X1 n=1 Tax=Nilaparvata lugens TaxID=108931 RepID=UPI00193DC86A|nr:uncharacterized protein LOC111044775 isoform X1 [Nilaparvata lugens]XP_039290956.1 uncharacterized protein LOC111044775 isoform X2 [Nilaparvata lugens]
MRFICSSLYPVLYLMTLIIYSEAVPVARTSDEGVEDHGTYSTTEENEWRDDESHTKDVDTQTELSNCKEDLESYKRALELEASKPKNSAPQNLFLMFIGKIEQNFLHLSLPPDHKPEPNGMKFGSNSGRGYVAKYHHCGDKGGCEEGRKDDGEEDERHEWIDEEHLLEELEKEMKLLLEGLKDMDKGGEIENIEVEKMLKEEED